MRIFLFTLLFTFLFPFLSFSNSSLSTKDLSVIYDNTYQYSYKYGKDSIFFKKLNDLKYQLDVYVSENEYNDTIIQAYVFYAYGIRFKEPVKSLKLAQHLIEVVKKNNLNSANPNVMHLLAKLYYSQGFINEALQIYKSTTVNFKNNNDLIGYAYSLIDIGNVYFRIEEYESAKDYYEIAKNIFSQHDENEKNKYYGLAVCNNNYGLISSKNENHKKALKYFTKAYKQRKNHDLTAVIPHSLYYLGNTHRDLGNPDSSKYYFLQAIKVSIENNITNEIPVSYFKYGEYLINKKPDSAIFYFKNSMKLADKINMIDEKMLIRNAVGNFYLHRNLDTAEFYFLELFELAEKVNNIDYLKNSADKLANIYQRKGDFKNKSKYTGIINKLLENQIKNNILKAQFSIEHDKWLEKNEELEEKTLMQKNRFNYLFAFSLLIISFVIILLFNRKKIKQKTKELEDTNIELKNVIDKRNTLYTIIAHDLKGPLGSGIKLIEHINSEKIPKEMEKGMMISLEKTFKTTYKLLIDLLSWVNINKDNFKIHAKLHLIHKLVYDTEILYKEKFEEKNINLINKTDTKLSAYFDYNTISTVVRNLIYNAIKFSQPGSEIIVDAKEEGDYVKVMVKDKGIGIPESTLNKLFNEDYKVSTYGTENESGSGLGLKLCKSLIEANQCEIYAKSTKNEGSTFYFTLLKSKPKQN